MRCFSALFAAFLLVCLCPVLRVHAGDAAASELLLEVQTGCVLHEENADAAIAAATARLNSFFFISIPPSLNKNHMFRSVFPEKQLTERQLFLTENVSFICILAFSHFAFKHLFVPQSSLASM